MPWSIVTGLDVLKPRNVTTVVALGDSITDGAFSEPNGSTRWPDLLNDRISTSPWRELRSVVNAGISGNMVSADRDGNALQGQAAVTRMAWDVLSQPGVSHLVVFEGINDVGEGVSGPQIVRGLRSIIQRARKRGITVVLGTLTPSYGAYLFGAPYHENQAPRDEVNRWVRSRPASTRLVDFSSAVATSTSPEAWQATLTVDFLHPSPIGMRVMANAFPIAALR